MKSKTTATALASLLLLLQVPKVANADLNAEFEALSGTAGADGAAWLELAVRARAETDIDIALAALQRAEAAGASAIRVALERVRLQIVQQQFESAVAQLSALADNGFTAVRALQGDAVINSLAGRGDYDALIERMQHVAFPCAHDERFRAFDFWLGEWAVHTADGSYAGRNVISAEESGCVMVERWTSAGGGTGMSVNYLDAATGQWVQVWNAEGGTQIDIRGGMTNEGMRLEGQIHYVAGGTTAPFRALWTPLEDGRVRQFFEQSNDGGATWQPWFEGFYSRIDAAGAGH